MSPRKTILRQLHRDYQERGQGEYRRPRDIAGFGERPEKYQRAVNRLLQERLIEGRPNDEGHLTLALNGNRIDQVHRELRSPWAHPGVWAAVALAFVTGAVLFM